MPNDNSILWTGGFLNERFTGPVSPLGWAHVGALFETLALRDPLRFMGYPDAETIPATRLWRGQPYVNAAILQIIYKPFPDGLAPADAVRYFPDGDLNYRKRAPYPTSRWQPRLVWALLRHTLRDALNVSPFNYVKWRRVLAAHDAPSQLLGARLAAATDTAEMLQCIAALYELDTQLLRVHRWSITYAEVCYKILAQWCGDLAPALISDTPNKTREVNAALAALTQLPAPLTADLLARLQTRAALNDAEQATARALETFLERHGHRAFSLDLAQPTFRDDPTQLLPLLAATPQTARAPDERAWRAAYAAARGTLRWWQRPLFRPLVALTRRYAQLREDQRYAWQKTLALTRRAYLQIGARWVTQNILAAAHDIFYATRGEVASFVRGELDAAALRARIEARQAEWRAYETQARARGAEDAPHFLRGDTPVFEPSAPRAAVNEWRGRGVSPGIARGAARIVHEPRDLGRVRAGEILVAPTTDPAWTPVFARLAGLVLERGGVLSHGAVVAREYHLPAVTAVAQLTRALQDGEWIEIDGTTGSVKRVAG